MSVTELREWITRLVSTIRPGRSDADLHEELRLHAAMAAEAPTARSGGPAAGGAPASVRTPGVAHAMDAIRDQRGVPWVDDLLRDLRYGLRVLNRQRMFAAVAVLTLAIGIGATTAVFSVVNGVLLRPLAYPESDRLVALRLLAPGAPGIADVSGDFRLSPSMFFTFAERNRTFQHLGIWYASTATVTGAGDPEEVRGVHVSHGTLQALGVTPAVGRWLSQADQQPGGQARVMLAHGYWRRRFGADPSVIGRTILVDGGSREIAGVMPAGFRVLDTDADLILPLRFDRSTLLLPGFGFQGIARLKPGVTLQEADADIGRMVPIWMNSWPAARGVDPHVYQAFRITPALRPLHAEVVGNVGDVLWIVMGTIGIVLLVACANVATLLLVRAEGRQQELAVRASLGAGRGRIARGLLIESVLLASISGAVGVALAQGGLRVLVAMGPANLPRLGEISLDSRSLAAALVIAAACGLLFGLLPAFRHGGPRVWNALRAGGRAATGSRERHRVRNVLVVAQVALAMVLLVSSGLMIRTSLALRSVEPGFTEPASIQTVRISIPEAIAAEPERVARLQHAIVERLSALPGVASVGYANVMHMEGLGTSWDAIQREDDPPIGTEVPPMRVFKGVSPRFFASTGTAVIVGRDYEWADLYGRRPVVIVSENLARELWGTPQQALGKRLRASLPGSPLHEVIGVVQDVRDNGVQQAAPAIVYWPALRAHTYRAGLSDVDRAVTFGLRTSRAGSGALLDEIEQAVWSVDASLPLGSVRTMQEAYATSMARTSFTLVMLSIAASAALVLGLVGIYGVIAYTVSQRTREIAIRLALGAQPGEVQRMFVRAGLALVAVGIAAGLAGAAASTRALASVLFGVDPIDPLTFAAVPLVLLTAALVASYLPARRAAATSPVEALKAE